MQQAVVEAEDGHHALVRVERGAQRRVVVHAQVARNQTRPVMAGVRRRLA